MSNFYALIKLAAQNDARQRFQSTMQDPSQNPVDALTDTLKNMNDEAKPFWLYDDKKDSTRSNVSWGASSPLGAGDAAERNGPFAAGMNIVFGGV